MKIFKLVSSYCASSLVSSLWVILNRVLLLGILKVYQLDVKSQKFIRKGWIGFGSKSVLRVATT